jgi:ribose transport system ATP-binding protein
MKPPANLPVLELRGVTKRYGRVTVLDDLDFDLRPGEVHGLIGENGAGKSITMKLLSGVFHDYQGEMRVRGKVVRFRSPAESQDMGIRMVYQELSVFRHLTVAENLFGRKPPRSMGIVDWKQMNREAQEYLNELGLGIDVSRTLGDLPVGNQQVVEIARIIFSGANIMILDEPTSALSQPESQRLFKFIDLLKTQGKSIIFISHFFEDVLAVTDRITVLRNGRKVTTLKTSEANKQQLVELMIGSDATVLERMYQSEGRVGDAQRTGDVMLSVADLSLRGEFEHVSFALHKGEVLGLFGFMGAGQFAVGRCLFGATPATSGTIILEGKRLRLRNTTAATTAGIAYVPENRHDGLMLRQEVYKNITLPYLKKIVSWRLNRKVEVATANQLITKLGIHPSDPTLSVGALSGGNQQKVVLAKWLVEQPHLLILSEPTRGIDLGAKAEVVTLINRLRDKGVPILLISSEPEIISIADRALAMKKGRVTAELQGSDLTKQNLMQNA